MKKQFLFLAFSFILKFSVGQNLVPNGDFEQYWGCPTHDDELDSAKFWFEPTIGTSDYYNQCSSGDVNVPNAIFGYQQANSGVAFAGIALLRQGLPSFREYLETSFTPATYSLDSNVCYHFEMYLNLGNISHYTSYNIGVYFSDTIITGINYYHNLPYTAQITMSGNILDTLNWTLVSGNYLAHGGEKYLIIGNFDTDLFYDTIPVSSTGNWLGAYVYIDDVSLVPCSSLGISNISKIPTINIFPNPTTSQLTITINNNEPSQIIIYDVTSRKIMEQKFIGTTILNIGTLAKGVYIYEVRNGKEAMKGKVVKE